MLARDLNKDLDEIYEMPYPDYIAWRGFYRYEAEMARQAEEAA